MLCFALRLPRKGKFGQTDFRTRAPGSSHSSILKWHAAAKEQMQLWLEFCACPCARCLNMCPRLEPQQHFDVACCNGITHVAVARVSCVSVCRVCPGLAPQQRFEAACCSGRLLSLDSRPEIRIKRCVSTASILLALINKMQQKSTNPNRDEHGRSKRGAAKL